ncbi:MAG: hypothetical protein A3F74_02495 [Betaproteobacteria bacterium RIFCSPLOWO2_12_FULL_62_58]|nr:MAG: hypothetical protein A3F74_02495 [Betaproteobacteria bacterium RIFCSPLOWO2_12_FULL_62_58]
MNGWLEALLLAAFVAGLTGGAHCAAMCGGIVGAVCAPRAGANTAAPRWRHALAYNFGRIMSYTAAGTLVGALGQAGLWLRGGPFAQQVLMFTAAMMLMVLALYVAGMTPIVRGIETAGSVAWRRIQPYSRWFLPVDSVPRALGLGVVWGWLPCGMVYALLLTALATADPGRGALVMFAFGLGTLPNLLAIALLFEQFRKYSRARAARIAASLIIAGVSVFGILKATQPAAFAADDGLLCHFIPGLSALLP